MTTIPVVRCASRFAGLAAALLLSTPALAVDLTVSSIQVNQGVQFGSTPLVANNTTVVRVTINTNGGGAIANVDAALRMSVNNVPVAGPPIFSLNGPITAPASPILTNLNDTINFMILAPVSNDVDFTVEVNPNRNVVETNYANNTFSLTNRAFLCKNIIELPYVPVNYTFNGAGLPAENLMEPGIGDGFVRGIYTTEWNYHKVATPPITWSQDINGSTSSFHNTLNNLRQSMSPIPPFIYAWLPGNPFGGNGQAGGIPSTTAFGNTELSRFQRTCAHELGHCIGLSHNSQTLGTVGFDEEHHLRDTQNLPVIHPSSQNDVMVAGLLTNQAWVSSSTYSQLLNHASAQCSTADGEIAPPPVPVLGISGVIMHDTRAVTLDPVTRFRAGFLTENNPRGDIEIIALNAAGQPIWSRMFRTDTARELCEPDANGNPVYSAHGPFFVNFPETVAGEDIHEVRIVDVATGNLLASRVRSPNAPLVAFAAIERVDQQGKNDRGEIEQPLTGRVRVSWNAADADGDTLTHSLSYSHDNGLTWNPVIVGTTETSVEFDASDLPSTAEAADTAGRFSLTTTDGLNISQSDEGGIALGEANPPRTFLLTPNNTNSFPQHAPIAFHGTSWDPEDRLLGGNSMVWTSSLDGEIGTGRLFIRSDLSVGTHVITLEGTDSANMSSSKQITITITPRTVISPDCNNNFVLDLVDIQNGTSQDLNGNGIPDECESTPCPADIVNSGSSANVVDIDDLLAVISAWGPCPAPPAACPANIVTAGASATNVDIDDLLAVISAWGACP